MNAAAGDKEEGEKEREKKEKKKKMGACRWV